MDYDLYVYILRRPLLISTLIATGNFQSGILYPVAWPSIEIN